MEGPECLVLGNPCCTQQEDPEQLEHDSNDESSSSCGPFWAPRHADSDCLPVPKNVGCNASREIPGNFSSPQSSWQPFLGTTARERESPKNRQRSHQRTLSHRSHLHHRRQVFTNSVTPSSLASCPDDFCRIRTTRYYLVSKKMFRPHEVYILLRWMQLQPGMSLGLSVQYQSDLLREARD